MFSKDEVARRLRRSRRSIDYHIRRGRLTVVEGGILAASVEAFTTSKLRLDQTPGYCAFCDDPLPPPRTVRCDKDECGRAYMAEHHIQRRAKHMFVLRKVVDLWGRSDGWFHLLACGHTVPAQTWSERQRYQRQCPTCPRGPA